MRIWICVLIYGLQTTCTLYLAQGVPWAARIGLKVACASAGTVECYIIRLHRLLMHTHKILIVWVHRLIKILFVSTRSDVCFITKALKGVSESLGEKKNIYLQGVWEHEQLLLSGNWGAIF